MKLSKCRVGDLVELYSEKCGIPNLTVDDISGINRDKEFFEPSKQVGADTSDYKIVPPGYFACNLMHVGRDVVLPIAWNHTKKNKIVSGAYFVFSLKKDSAILDEFFFMMMKSEEKDRFFWFNTDTSVRDGMSWPDFCDVEIEYPEKSIQEKYVNVYKGMLRNRKSIEQGNDDLLLTCHATLEKLRRTIGCKRLGDYIEEVTERNDTLQSDNVQGVSKEQIFISTKADVRGVNLSNYKVVGEKMFAYNPTRINLGSIALCRDNCIVSPMYVVFKVNAPDVLLPEYLMIWFSRSEFLRSTFFFATGSVRDTFSYELMEEVQLPIPDLETQKSLASIYALYRKRIECAERLKVLTQQTCPILVRGAINEACQKV